MLLTASVYQRLLIITEVNIPKSTFCGDKKNVPNFDRNL